MRRTFFAFALIGLSNLLAAPAGWTTESVRDEIRPKFTYDSTGGRGGSGAFVIETDQRDGLDGSTAFARFAKRRELNGRSSAR
jgi:hypothetical protein